MFQKKYLSVIFLVLFIILAGYFYAKRADFQTFLKEVSEYESDISSSDIYWANEILNGGYILHFRHAERDKWIDVQMYDALESDVHTNGANESRYAEKDYFEEAVCLNERGKIQARAIGEHIKNIGLPIGYVVSSVSCRARQTADLAFGGFTSQHRILVHSGPYKEKEEIRIKNLKDFYQNLNLKDGTNTIVSAHNKVIKCQMFKSGKCPKKLSLEEGGFYVISKVENGLKFEYEFHNYNDFNRVFYSR